MSERNARATEVWRGEESRGEPEETDLGGRVGSREVRNKTLVIERGGKQQRIEG